MQLLYNETLRYDLSYYKDKQDKKEKYLFKLQTGFNKYFYAAQTYITEKNHNQAKLNLLIARQIILDHPEDINNDKTQPNYSSAQEALNLCNEYLKKIKSKTSEDEIFYHSQFLKYNLRDIARALNLTIDIYKQLETHNKQSKRNLLHYCTEYKKLEKSMIVKKNLLISSTKNYTEYMPTLFCEIDKFARDLFNDLIIKYQNIEDGKKKLEEFTEQFKSKGKIYAIWLDDDLEKFDTMSSSKQLFLSADIRS